MKLTNKQFVIFALCAILFSLFFYNVTESLTSNSKCSDAKSCSSCGELKRDSEGSICYWCKDKCVNTKEYDELDNAWEVCAQGCRAPPNPPPSTDPYAPRSDDPYIKYDITTVCPAPCALDDKNYCMLDGKTCPATNDLPWFPNTTPPPSSQTTPPSSQTTPAQTPSSQTPSSQTTTSPVPAQSIDTKRDRTYQCVEVK